MEIKKKENVKKTYINNESKNIFINFSKLMIFYKHFKSVLEENKSLFTKLLQNDQVKKKFNVTSKKITNNI